MATQHKYKFDDGGNRFYYLPQNVTMPEGNEKYWTGFWQANYNLNWLADMVYGDKNLYWLILAANGLADPFQLVVGREFRVLLPAFRHEVKYD